MPEQRYEQVLLELFAAKRFVRSRDVVAAGVPRVYLTRLVRRGLVERLGRGLYALVGAPSDERETYAQVCVRVPKAIICCLTASQMHVLTTVAPPFVSVALPPGTPRPKLDFVGLEIVWADPRFMGESSVERWDYFGAEIRVTSKARTVVDLFRFRNRVGLDLAVEALREFVATPWNLPDLWREAKLARVESVIAPFVQALI